MWGYVSNYNYYCLFFEQQIAAGDPRYSHWLVTEKAATDNLS
jgi:hypothetical protein